MGANSPPADTLDLIKELRQIARHGFDASTDLIAPHLSRVGQSLDAESDCFAQVAVEAALAALVDRHLARAAHALFGIQGSCDRRARQAGAAAAIPTTARRPLGTFEPRLIEAIALAIRGLEASATDPSLPTGELHRFEAQVNVRDAIESDRSYVISLMQEALQQYYDGDHRAHAERIFSTHIAGGDDGLGFFSLRQHMLIATLGASDGSPRLGMIHLVVKRQRTVKISPLIVTSGARGRLHVGARLLRAAEQFAARANAREIYCTVARENTKAIEFFRRQGFKVAGHSASHYRPGVTEFMLYKMLELPNALARFDSPHISVEPLLPTHEPQVRSLLLSGLADGFLGIDNAWVDALFAGYERRHAEDVHQKYKLIFVATARDGTVLGVAGATPKKGQPIKVMPLLASTIPAFTALITDIPFLLRAHGRKLYTHVLSDVDQTIALQGRGWKLDAALPGAYHAGQVTMQWSLDIDDEDFMRSLRVKQHLLDCIKTGSKTLEVRVAYQAIKTIAVGERLCLQSRDDREVVRVRDIRHYPTFTALAQVEPLSKIIPGTGDREALRLLRQIYPPHKEALGIVVLEFQAIDDGATVIPVQSRQPRRATQQ